MGIRLGWFGIHGAGAARVVEALRETCSIARREDIPERFRVLERRPSRSWYTFWRRHPPTWTTVILTGDSMRSAPIWAQAVSLLLERPVISFDVNEGRCTYAVFESGHDVLVDGALARCAAETLGDRKRAARLLGADPALFDRYRDAVTSGQREPFPGDWFAPTDEWAHIDFARRVGPLYPIHPSAGRSYRPTRAEIARAGTDWTGLPARAYLP